VVPGGFFPRFQKPGRGNGPAACGSSKNTRGERPSGRRRMASKKKTWPSWNSPNDLWDFKPLMVIYHDFKPLMVIYHDFNPWPLRDIWDFKPLTMDYGPINQY